ncbi:nitrile hydratase subunit beta [Algihabitans albus]|uniref:nitrile hydratase subunit beta n=1 Tax=Algihabitans albus TaxID=2164067 RepID=UPI000E5D0EE6|nr:nitrile hydratase subunit beta [Algihabitans albus]
MNGAHDLGGMQGFGPVEPDETSRGGSAALFKADWERRVFGLTLAVGATGRWNIDMSRYARENQAPGAYLAKSYYQIWLQGLETLLVQSGLCSREEIEQGRSLAPPAEPPRVLKAAQVAATLAKGGPSARAATRPPAFVLGDRVVAKVMAPAGHTRLPRYLRGRPGQILLHHGAHVFPDTNACGGGEQPEHLYSVAFDAKDIWGEQAYPGSIRVDCFEPYLDPAA